LQVQVRNGRSEVLLWIWIFDFILYVIFYYVLLDRSIEDLLGKGERLATFLSPYRLPPLSFWFFLMDPPYRIPNFVVMGIEGVGMI
jgi:hypothetical protein